MLNKNKYWKALLGSFAEVLIPKQVEYTDDTTYKDFVANAAEGEFGFFNADTLAAISGALVGSPAAVAPVGSTTWIFAAVKRDGQIEKTEKFRLADYKITRTAYAAAVAQVSTATFTGSPVAGKAYGIRIIETTPGNQPYPTWYYEYVAKTGDDVTAVATALKNAINSTTSPQNKDTDPIVTATNASGVLTITAKEGGPTFRIGFSSDALTDLSAAAAYTGGSTALASWGSGTYDQVKELEKETNVYKGVTTQYPLQGSNPEDWGQPTAFAASGVQYSIYAIRGTANEASPTPVERHYQPHLIILAIPSNGAANADAEVQGILGL